MFQAVSSGLAAPEAMPAAFPWQWWTLTPLEPEAQINTLFSWLPCSKCFRTAAKSNEYSPYAWHGNREGVWMAWGRPERGRTEVDRRGIRENEKNTMIHKNVTMKPSILRTNYKHCSQVPIFFLKPLPNIECHKWESHGIKKSQEKGREDWETIRFWVLCIPATAFSTGILCEG